MNKRILNLLVRSFDGGLSDVETGELEAALAASLDLRKEKSRLQTLRGAIVSTRRDSFGPFFADKVINRIATRRVINGSRETFWKAIYNAFRPVAIAGAVVVIGLVIYNLVQTDDISITGAMGVSVTSDELMKPPVEAILEATS
ncbi:MAG: hypothetical protein V1694_13135 [Candidatus Eisenbacteria bacterium]